jgi:hypothetical protein
MVAHYHPHDNYWALVEPNSRVKVDIFGWEQALDLRIIHAPYKNSSLPIKSVESQLAKTVHDTRKVIRGEAVDPKQFKDAELLLDIADPTAAYELFAALESPPLPPTIQGALQEARQAAEEHPELLVPKPFRKPKMHTCSECVDTTDYPLTLLAEIYDLTQT